MKSIVASITIGLSIVFAASATGSAQATESDKLSVLAVTFDPVAQGKNVVRIKVHNPRAVDLVFGVHIYARSPDLGGGWGAGSEHFEPIGAGLTNTFRFAFKMMGAPTPATYVRLRFYSLRSKDEWEYPNHDEMRRYGADELPIRQVISGVPVPTSAADAHPILDVFDRLQHSLREQDYDAARELFTQDWLATEFTGMGSFSDAMQGKGRWVAVSWSRDEFLELRPTALYRRDDGFTLTAERADQTWTVDVVREENEWRIDRIIGVPAALGWSSWAERLRQEMHQRQTEHYDIFYWPGSTAEREIESIVAERERAYDEIARWTASPSQARLQLFLFEDGRSKWLATGHTGAGWATGNRMVEVYNDQTKLDPYHEPTHVLMHERGDPPAALNEGLATYLTERLGRRFAPGKTVFQTVLQLWTDGEEMSLTELLSFTEIGSGSSRPRVSYPLAGALVKYLVEQHGKEKFFEAHSNLMNPNDTTVHGENIRRLEAVYGRPLEQLESEWRQVIAAEKLEVLELAFEPIIQGTNVVRVRVRNSATTDLILGTLVFTWSPDFGREGYGASETYFEPLAAGQTRTLRFPYKIMGPVTPQTYVLLRFSSLLTQGDWEQAKFGDQRKLLANELPVRERVAGDPIDLAAEEAEPIMAVFGDLQQLLSDGQYEQALSIFTRDWQKVEFDDAAAEFLGAMQGEGRWFTISWSRDEFIELHPTALYRRDDGFTLTAERADQTWTVDVVRRENAWRVDRIIGVPAALEWSSWDERLRQDMQHRETEYYDIFYWPGSTAERDIDTIASQRERAYAEIAAFVSSAKVQRIELFLFEDERSKLLATGHQGHGWATGKRMVEVYSDQTKLDPYHEPAHVVMNDVGNPPAVFREGVAVYLAERLGRASALKYLGGGDQTIFGRARQLKAADEWIPLAELLGFSQIGSSASRPVIAYPLAAAFIKFLIENYGREKFLEAYRTLANVSDEAARSANISRLESIYGVSLEQLERASIEAIGR